MTAVQCPLIVVSHAQEPKGHLVQQSVVMQSPAQGRLLILALGTKVARGSGGSSKEHFPLVQLLFQESWKKEGVRLWRTMTSG